MARRSQCSSAGDNPLDPNYLPPHYREEYRLAIDALVEEDLEGYYKFLQKADVVDFLSTSEIQYIQHYVQIPQHHPENPERWFLETGGDESSDTYWPIHSDMEVPGLDLGWPQLHHFVGPTEVTTLVNPPEPDMPSIKDQARRLIKNAQQVIAVVMDMFTDVDMFADILNAAMRNVPVYILLDEQNAHHFVNMVLNCRVNLQSIQFLRVRTVSGITYHCRSGKTFKGQMMDRFLLTDCRAVLSGNYSFMWSFEKLHRSMAHLFFGQLVSTFDEEFRILFAQSHPLTMENVTLPMEDFNLSQKRQVPSDRASLYRESRKFLDTGHPEEWPRHSYDERMDVDLKMMPLKKQESLHGPSDMYTRFPSQQPPVDSSFDQGLSRIPMTENTAFKRHSYAEGGHGRFSYPFQQGVPEPENQRGQFLRGQQLYPGPGLGPESDYSGGEKFWSQDYHSADKFFEPQEMQQPYNFDHVFNYLSSTRNVDFEPSSDQLQPEADLPFSSSHPRRQSLGQPYPCQTSPTHSNPTDQMQFFPESNVDRKDPKVKRGLRNWRITSYLSAYDNPEEEDLLSAPPQAPPQAPEPVEEPSYPIQQTAPVIDFPFPKIPNVREFKVHALPRASQMPSYAKIPAREQPKKLPDEPSAVVAETKITPTPSESSSTTEGEKTEEAEQKDLNEPKTSILRREDSFRRKYSPATPRSSRLRSSLIFSSLEQQHSQEAKTTPGQQDEEIDKNEGVQKKLPFVSQVLGQRRSATRELIEWSRFMKPATSDNVAPEILKPDNGKSKSDDIDPVKEENLKDRSEPLDSQESLKPLDVEQANVLTLVPESKPSKAELSKINKPAQPLKSLFTTPSYVDMNDPDMRLMFFKELAAQRKAAIAAEAKKTNDKSLVKPSSDLKDSTTFEMKEPDQEETPEMVAESNADAEKALKPPADLKNKTTVKIEEPDLKAASEKMTEPLSCDSLLEKHATEMVAGKTVSTVACETISDKTDENEHSMSQSCEEKEARDSESENIGLKSSQSAASLPFSAEVESPPVKPPEEPTLSNPAVKEGSPSHPPTPTNATAANFTCLLQGTAESESLSPESTSKHFTSLTPSSIAVPPSPAYVKLDFETQRPGSVQSESAISSHPLLSEQHAGSELVSSNPCVVESTSSELILQDSGSQISPILPPSSLDCVTTPTDNIYVSQDDSNSALTSLMLPIRSDNTEAQECDSPLVLEPLKLDKECIDSESTEVTLEPVCRLTLSETPLEVQAAHVESDISHDTQCAVGSEANTSSLLSTPKRNPGESWAPTPSEKYIFASESGSYMKAVAEEPQVPGLSEKVKADTVPPRLVSLLPETSLPDVLEVEGSTSKPDRNEIMNPTSNQPDPQTEHSSSQAVFPVPSNSDMIPSTSQSDSPTQATPPSELNLTEPATPTLAEPLSCASPQTESTGSLLSPESENTEIDISVVHSPSDTNPLLKHITKDSNETGTVQAKVPKEPDVLLKTPESVTPESHPSEPSAENTTIDNQREISKDTELPDPGEKKPEVIDATNDVNKMITLDSVSNDSTNDQKRKNSCSEPAVKVTSEEVVPLSPQSKQLKSSQSRYHSSTANVLSSSNLRDDTKLLLEQISANSQSRNEAAKETPVTDDEKEDKADKNAQREKERGIKIPGRGQPKSTQERDKVLERIQSMRKERRVYSRFEV